MKESENLEKVESLVKRAEERVSEHASNDALRLVRDTLRRIGHLIAAERLRAELDEAGEGGHPVSLSNATTSDWTMA